MALPAPEAVGDVILKADSAPSSKCRLKGKPSPTAWHVACPAECPRLASHRVHALLPLGPGLCSVISITQVKIPSPRGTHIHTRLPVCRPAHYTQGAGPSVLPLFASSALKDFSLFVLCHVVAARAAIPGA